MSNAESELLLIFVEEDIREVVGCAQLISLHGVFTDRLMDKQVLIGHLYTKGSLLTDRLHYLLDISLTSRIKHVQGYVYGYECA